MNYWLLVAVWVWGVALTPQAWAADPATPIQIGAIFSLSGWGAEGGSSELFGALLAQDDLNARGGIRGQPIHLVVEDNHSDLKSTASAFQKLISVDNVPAVLGPNWAEFVEIVSPLAEERHVPMISPSGYKGSVFQTTKYSFSLWPPHTVAVRPLVAHLRQRGFQSVTVFITENAYFEEILAALRSGLQGSPTQLNPIVRFSAAEQDFRSSITRLKSSPAQAVVALILENSGLVPYLRQMRQLGLALPHFTANGPAFDEMLKKEPSLAEGLVYFDYTVPGSDEFRARFRARFSKEPGFASAKAYDGVMLLAHTIEQCGAAREAISRCLHQEKYQGISGTIQFDTQGVIASSENNSRLLQIIDGTVRPL